MEYTGNAIYDYVCREDLDYYYSAEHNWMLVYGNAASIPKIMVFASKAADIDSDYTADEKREVNKAFSIARYFKLPFLFVRFMANHDRVVIWEESDGRGGLSHMISLEISMRAMASCSREPPENA